MAWRAREGVGKLCLKTLFFAFGKEKSGVSDTPTVLWAPRIPFTLLCMQPENIRSRVVQL